MTEKLYDYDAYLTEFTAQVISCTPFQNGYMVILDKTAFFPEEGGQYSDRGTLSEANVFDVQLENGELIHYTDKPVKDAVCGKIDFRRRFRNMQNHTGEHIISGLIHTLFGGENVGFHLGEDEVTCDYDIELTSEQLKTVEIEANKAIYKNLCVSACYPNAEELKKTLYRSKKEIDEAIRIVTVDKVDCCACCAPHVKNTGEIGVIKILSYMRLRGGCRLFIACGLDAFTDYSLKHEEIKSISATLASKSYECAQAVQKINDSLKQTVREVNFLKTKVFENKIENLAYSENGLLIFTEDTDNNTLRSIVNLAKEKSPLLCSAFSGNDNDGYSFVLFSDSEDINSLSKRINDTLCGHCGGKSPMLQGSMKCKREEIRNFFSKAEFVLF
ncbi:MAG: alanyl-tRNA editing protein [Acutalibacteraceae bacterium]|nr:alanyl-tRNA editing protein [Acutalibacteraceae bacterium]